MLGKFNLLKGILLTTEVAEFFHRGKGAVTSGSKSSAIG